MRTTIPALALALAACGGGGGSDGPTPTLTPVDGVTWAAAVDHELFPLPVGATWAYEADTPDGREQIAIEVLADPATVNGVTAVAVQDTATLDGEVVEDTTDWYAQDTAGNVWYLGEDTCEFEGGACVRRTGSWRWGDRGALPGVIMPAHPTVDGTAYYQEFLAGEAEDVGEVIAVGVDVTAAGHTFSGCVTTHDTSTLDGALDETKTYCPGVGNVVVHEPDQDETLTASSLL